MSIKILYPHSGTAKQPTTLPQQFLVYGTKDPKAVPFGILISVGPDGTPDGRYRIGGATIVFKPDRDGQSQDPTKWLLKFVMPSQAPLPQRYVVVVVDSQDLPSKIHAQTHPARADFLARRSQPISAEKMNLRQVEQPVAGGTYAREDFFAYGVVPAGNSDFDRTDSKLVVNSTPPPATISPGWGDTDPSSGIWFMFFDAIPNNVTNVDLQVVYTPNLDQENVLNITLT